MDRRLIAIFVLLFALFMTGTRFCLDGYELEYFLSAMNIFHGNGPALASGFEGCPGISDTTGDTPVFPRQNLAQSYMSLPFYALGAWIFGENPSIPDRGKYWQIPWGPLLTVSMLNPLLAALTVVLLILMARDFGLKSPQDYQLGVIYGLTSMVWHYSGFGLEIVQTAVLMATVYCAIHFRFTGKWRWLIGAGVLMMILPNCKKYSGIFLLPVLTYLFWSIRTRFAKHANALMLGLGVIVTSGVLLMCIGMIIRFRADPYLFPHLLGTVLTGGFKSIDLIYGLIISPGEGILIYNPILFFAIPGWFVFYRKFKAESLMFLGMAGLLLIILWRVPYVLIDEEWGPRYLFSLTPFMFLAGIPSLFQDRTKWMKRLFICVLILGFLVSWLSSLYLGFKVLDAALYMDVPDYFILVFTPSMSQIYLTLTCFASYVFYQFTDRHLELSHRVYSGYTGIGGRFETLRTDLKYFDYPSGGFFTVRWFFSEKGWHEITPDQVFYFKLFTDFMLIKWLLFFCRKRKQVPTAQAASN